MNTRFKRLLRLDSPLMRGNDVLLIQSAMNLPAAQRDGVFGLGTQRAVMALQNDKHVRSDGVVGPTTWALIVGTDEPSGSRPEPSADPGIIAARFLSPLREYHRRYSESVAWRLTTQGLEVQGRGVETSGGKPETVRRVCHDYRDALTKVSRITGVPVELLIATMCTEAYSGSMRTVNPRATRREPGYISDAATPHRVSYGLSQTLLSTARQAVEQFRGAVLGVSPRAIDREWLYEPANALLAGAAFISEQMRQTQFDPPVVACAYNAGSVIHNSSHNNRWRMRQYPIGTDEHANRFVRWFNDCFLLFQDEGHLFDGAITFWHLLRSDDAGAVTLGASGSAISPLALVGPVTGNGNALSSRTDQPGSATSEAMLRTTAPLFIFPHRTKPTQSYKDGERQFGANRNKGARKHAGCDLKAPKGTPIFAMADGRVIRGPSYFYTGTYALEVKHANGMVVRYGEIDAKVPKGISTGAQVRQGQLIAYVGRLNSGSSMLHLEMYSGAKSGALTQPGNKPYQRRGDLVDPTHWLDTAPLLDHVEAGTLISEPSDLEHRILTPTPREPTRWDKALKSAPTSGASLLTAGPEGLTAGIPASHQIAARDLTSVKKNVHRFHSAGSKLGIPPALLAGLASRLSRCGAMLSEDGWNREHSAFGILQISGKDHDPAGLTDPTDEDHIEQAAAILCEQLEKVLVKHSDWEDGYLLKGAVVAYDAGIGTVGTREKMDVGSSHDDFGSDVIARAQFYHDHSELDELRH